MNRQEDSREAGSKEGREEQNEQIGRQEHTKGDRKVNRQTYRQIRRHKGTLISKQTNKQAEINEEPGRQANRQTDS